MTVRLYPALLGSLLLAAGCAALAPRIEAPSVELIKVDLTEMEVRRQRFDVVLRLSNPNDRDIPVRALDYRIRLAGRDFARGRSTREFTLPAHGEADLEATVATDLVKSMVQMLHWLDDSPDALDYEIAGRIDTGGWFGAIPFSERGEVRLR